MTYAQEVANAVSTLIDLCVYREGACEECEAYKLCNSQQPKDLVSTKLSQQSQD